jgi:two-component system capsular synthesis response regulator RcsB
MRILNVVIADDHPIVLFGLRELIQRDTRFALLGEAVGSSQLVDVIEAQQPDVVITDFNMPGDATYGDGLKLVEYLIRRYPGTQVLVLTMISNPLILTRLHELGVAGVIDKKHLHEEIEKALTALAGQRRYSSVQPQPSTVTPNVQDLHERMASLSARELEVLRLFVSGLSVSDIARGLKRSVKTVSTQKVSAMRKLEVDNDQNLLVYCVRARVFE